jgi:hypothetical protein
VSDAVTRNGFHARRSLDLVPALTREALWIDLPLSFCGNRSSLEVWGGEWPGGGIGQGGTGSGAFHQGPVEHLGDKFTNFTFRLL